MLGCGAAEKSRFATAVLRKILRQQYILSHPTLRHDKRHGRHIKMLLLFIKLSYFGRYWVNLGKYVRTSYKKCRQYHCASSERYQWSKSVRWPTRQAWPCSWEPTRSRCNASIGVSITVLVFSSFAQVENKTQPKFQDVFKYTDLGQYKHLKEI